MRTRKFTGFIIMLFVMIFIAAASAVYADSVATVSNITVSGPTLTNLNYSSRVADVINNVKVNHSGLGISTEVQVYLGGEWATCTSEEFFSGQYRLKMNIYSTDNTDTRYMIGSSPAVKYNGTECTIGNCTQYAVYAYTEPFYANAQYSLTVAGKPVTTVNSADILGDGSKKFVYDSATYTLTVNGDYTYTNGSIIVNNGIKGLTINIAGDSVLTSDGSAIRCGKNDTTITGSGKLTLNSQNNIGIYINGEGAVLTIDNADINVSGNSAISGNSSTNEKLIINNSKITASGTNYAISSFGGGITLDNCKVLTPENPLVTAYDILDSNGRIAQNVTIGYTDYPLYIAGTQVTENNAANILGDGVFKYEPVTNTLTVNGSCTVSNGNVIRSDIDGLTIDITGDSVLTTKNGSALDLGSTAAITSTQNRVLSINGTYGTGIVCNNFLNIINANITIKGNRGITNKISSASGTLDINNSYIYLDTNKVNSAIRRFRTFTLDDCKITSPAGAVYKDYILYENDGETVASKVTIEPISEYPLTVAGIGVTRENAADILGNGSREFTYDSKTKTLSVNGSYYYSGDFLIQNMGIEDLTIFIADNSDLHTTGGSTIYCKDYATTIKGTGKAKLQLFADNVCILTNSGSLAIEDLYLETNRGTSGVYGIKGMSKSKLTIRNSQIDVRATVSAISYFTDVEFEGCRIDIPYNAVNNGTVFESDGTTAAKTVTTKPNNYGLSIAGTSVNTLNAGDILGDGRFSFDAEAKTLYVNGDCTSSNILIYNTGIDDLTINIAKDVTFTENGSNPAMFFFKKTKITGDGILTLKSSSFPGISVSGAVTLYIKDAFINVSGKKGITSVTGNSALVIDNSKVEANGTNGGISGFSSITTRDCMVVSPSNAQLKNGTVYESDGTTLAVNAVISGGDVNLNGTTDKADAALVLKYISTGEAFFTDTARNAKAEKIADVDGNNNIDMLDAIAVAKIADL